MNCQRCNKPQDGTYGSGKFCSRQCANSRSWTAEDKLKKSLSGKEFYSKTDYHPTRGKSLKPMTEAEKELRRVKNIEYWDKIGRRTEEHVRTTRRISASKRRAKVRDAIPYDADLKLIRRIFENTPKGYDVDHIIPIAKGGLHHQDNLQYLPSLENKRKGDRDNYDKSLVVKWQQILPQ